MSKIVFVPLTDEMLFERPDMIAGPITTYQPTFSKNANRYLGTMRSPRVSGAYLKGDMVNGLEVVYAGKNSIRGIRSKRYRALNRGISFG